MQVATYQVVVEDVEYDITKVQYGRWRGALLIADQETMVMAKQEGADVTVSGMDVAAEERFEVVRPQVHAGQMMLKPPPRPRRSAALSSRCLELGVQHVTGPSLLRTISRRRASNSPEVQLAETAPTAHFERRAFGAPCSS